MLRSAFQFELTEAEAAAAGVPAGHAWSMAALEGGVRFRVSDVDVFVPWTDVRFLEEPAGNLRLGVAGGSFVPIGAGAFEGPAERAAFIAMVRRRTGLDIKVAAPEAVHPPLTFPRTLLNALRLSIFLRPLPGTATEGPALWSQLIALGLLMLLPTFFAGLFRLGTRGTVNFSALPAIWFVLPLSLGAAWALALLGKRPVAALPLLVALVGVSVPLDAVLQLALIFIGLRDWPFWESAAPAIAAGWLGLSGAIAAIRSLQLPPRRWIAAAVIPAVCLSVPLSLVDRYRSPWVSKAAAEDEERAGPGAYVTSEDAFYRQQTLLAEKLAALKPGRPGVIELYFVGAAPDATQDVFMRELRSVHELFDDRFDTAGRSIALTNNYATALEAPIATLTSLRRSVERVAQVMNRDQDILFLFLTAHGSKSHELSMRLPPMQLEAVNPAALKTLLDGSGIKYRVVVVSACYSGGFIDALKGPGTLVITASAADKRSFGCSNEADFTYFGRAFFDEALRETWSFKEAFALALPVIERRERRISTDRSEPQLSMGSEVERQLERFEVQRQAAGSKDAARDR